MKSCIEGRDENLDGFEYIHVMCSCELHDDGYTEYFSKEMLCLRRTRLIHFK